ncbi:peptidase family S49-domain-containing protein [Dunaliella salina]|uniref:Peptidase family S49-domain-containing protein n=1 Tax=Dunaliella salina TaxID=3046 RepID=A0ABQ7G5P1_DUNSA|nr:peptidase family S49-domain-containing protein [Dunaliella salina]|eukprot:KAF5829926.1 peptidase family S49-domain-containing protein [Dunaliella salina]
MSQPILQTPPPTPWLPRIRKTLGRGLAFLGAGAVLNQAAASYIQYKALQADKQLPEEFVLEVDLQRLKVVEQLPTDPLAALRGAARQVELQRVVRALDTAAADERVRGLMLNLGDRESLGGMAMVQELRDALSRFSATSKGRAPTVAMSPAFGEAGSNGTIQYYLASACDKVFMQPSGTLGLLGLQSQQFFLRDALDKAQVEPILYTREDYKTAGHLFTQRGFTPQHREQTTSLLEDITSQMWEAVAASRGMSMDSLLGTVARAPLLAAAALKDGMAAATGKGPRGQDQTIGQENKGGGTSDLADPQDAPPVPPEENMPAAPLLDGLLYRDEVEAMFLKSSEQAERDKGRKKEQGGWWGKTPEADRPSDAYMARVPLTKYSALQEVKAAAMKAEAEGGRFFWSRKQAAVGPQVAVVHAAGTIVQGPVMPGQTAPNQQLIDATKLSAALKKLADTPDVGAVVLRLNSPGGSALGSDLLHHALVRLRTAGKKLVVSCGDVAASGGMFMAVAGDKIFAQPGTLTGSIGVITGKFHVAQLLEGYGVNPASIESGSPNLNLTSPFVKPSEKQVRTINHLMDAIYDDFLRKVAAGRGMSVESVRKAAGGRVYTGKQALQAGLVDAHGGLREAIAEARRLAGVDESKTDEQVVFPYPVPRLPLIARLIRAAGPAGGMGPPPDQDLPPPTPQSNPPKSSTGVLGSGGWMVSGSAGWLGQQLLMRYLMQGASAHDIPPGGSSQIATLTPSHSMSLPPHLSSLAAVAAAYGVGSASGGSNGHLPVQAQQMQAALATLMSAAAALDGNVAAYSPEADALARGIV